MLSGAWRLEVMAFKLGVVSVLCLMVVGAMTRENMDCYSTDSHPYLMFGLKTAYDLIYERPRQRSNEIPDCEPVQLWLLARHGTRYPGRSTIRAMQQLENLRTTIVQNHEDRRNGRLCYGDLDRLRGWTLNVSMTDAKMLTPQGRSDMYFLAKRFRTRYPSLFSQGYSQNLFVFRHTDTERTRQSAMAFSEGMFGPAQGVWIPAPIENDTIIKPYENCTTWRNHVRSDPTNLREIELFRAGLDMNNLVHNVSQRLGFLYDLAADSVLLMYDMCRYDKAWNLHDRSAWCAAFSREELQVLEYFDDLKSFYEAGYGNELNLRLGCTPIKDMLEKFHLLEVENLDNGYQPTGVFYFTHSDMLAMTIARMGIASHGKPMRHDNFPEQRKREWATSKITPFASNLAAVFFKCSSGEHNRVMFFLNEKMVDFPDCNLGLCSWADVKERFKDIPYNCDLNWCSGAAFTKVSTLFIGLLFVVHFFRNL